MKHLYGKNRPAQAGIPVAEGYLYSSASGKAIALANGLNSSKFVSSQFPLAQKKFMQD